MAVNVPPTAVGSNDGLGPVGKKMTTEEFIRTDGKAGAFLWWGEVPNGAFLFTEQQVQKLLAAERERMCAAIKAADDKASEGDYMLDSDDCISVIRGTWNPGA